MAALNKVASYFADEIRDGIAWVIIWKTARSWHGYAAWPDPDTETFEPDDLEKAHEVLEEDPNAVMLNGYYCGHFGEDMNALEIAAGIRWHYENRANLLMDNLDLEPPKDPIWEWVPGLKLFDGSLQILSEKTQTEKCPLIPFSVLNPEHLKIIAQKQHVECSRSCNWLFGGDNVSKPYRECPNCGAHLDHGEHCDCKDRQREPDPAAQSAGKLATGNRREPVLMPGA